MQFMLKLVLSVAIAIVIGGGSALLFAERIFQSRMIENGPWRTSLLAGSPQADLYTRAAVAQSGLLALNNSEAIYFIATTDNEGEPLRGRCNYVVTGGSLPARWWSVTAYGSDYFLIENAKNRFSFTGRELLGTGGGRFALSVSALRKPEPWLPAGERGRFSLLLRLYDPEPAVVERPASAPLPAIEEEGCL
ncbi:MAG: DUF1214 domain-containing protein [Alphaproteobacteria bacterium]